MVQILDRPDFGTRLGSYLGGNIDQALNQFSQMKLQQILDRQRQAKYSQAFQGLGIPREVANRFAMFPEASQKELMKTISQYAPMESIFGTQESPVAQDNIQEALQGNNKEVAAAPERGLRDVLGTQSPQQIAMQPLMQKAMGPVAQQPANPSIGIAKAQESAPMRQANAAYRPRNAAEAREMRETRREQLMLDKEARLEQIKRDKDYRGYIKDMSEEYKDAEMNDRRLNRMEELIQSKNLTRPRLAAALNTLEHGFWGVGLNLHSLMSPESQEFDKLSKEFLKNAKNMFGSRITDADLKTFLKMVPDLSQSREGKRRIIHNMRLYNEGVKIRKKTMDEVLKENGGHAPLNLETLVEDRAASELDKLAERFKTGYQKPKKEIKQESTILGMKNPHPIKGGLDLLFGKG